MSKGGTGCPHGVQQQVGCLLLDLEGVGIRFVVRGNACEMDYGGHLYAKALARLRGPLRELGVQLTR